MFCFFGLLRKVVLKLGFPPHELARARPGMCEHAMPPAGKSGRCSASVIFAEAGSPRNLQAQTKP